MGDVNISDSEMVALKRGLLTAFQTACETGDLARALTQVDIEAKREAEQEAKHKAEEDEDEATRQTMSEAKRQVELLCPKEDQEEQARLRAETEAKQTAGDNLVEAVTAGTLAEAKQTTEEEEEAAKTQSQIATREVLERDVTNEEELRAAVRRGLELAVFGSGGSDGGIWLEIPVPPMLSEPSKIPCGTQLPVPSAIHAQQAQTVLAQPPPGAPHQSLPPPPPLGNPPCLPSSAAPPLAQCMSGTGTATDSLDLPELEQVRTKLRNVLSEAAVHGSLPSLLAQADQVETFIEQAVNLNRRVTQLEDWRRMKELEDDLGVSMV